MKARPRTRRLPRPRARRVAGSAAVKTFGGGKKAKVGVFVVPDVQHASGMAKKVNIYEYVCVVACPKPIRNQPLNLIPVCLIVCQELDLYRETAGSEFNDGKLASNAPILTWWKEHAARFPYLSQLTRRYLAMPATSASVERLFSVAGQVVTAKRARAVYTPTPSHYLCFYMRPSPGASRGRRLPSFSRV